MKIINNDGAPFNKAKANFVLGLVSLILFLLSSSVTHASPKWHMVDCNVGKKHGDCHLLVDGNVNVLVDAASELGADKYLIPFLKRNNIKNIDHFIVSHPHTDHYGGIKSLNKANIKVKNIYFNEPPLSDWDYKPVEFKAVLRSSEALGARLHQVNKGDRIKLATSTITILEAKKEGQKSVNDYSIVMRWVAGGYSSLFTGDLDVTLGNKLAGDPMFAADFYKAPHHGVDTIAPKAFSDTVAPVLTMVPTSTKLWNHVRSREFKGWAESKNSMQTCVNGINGTVSLEFNNTSVRVSAERDSPRCKSGTIYPVAKRLALLKITQALVMVPILDLLLSD